MTNQQWQERGATLLASLSDGERRGLYSLFTAERKALLELAYSPALRRMCFVWRNVTGREWMDGELYYCLLAFLS